jgi:hypothetical protein
MELLGATALTVPPAVAEAVGVIMAPMAVLDPQAGAVSEALVAEALVVAQVLGVVLAPLVVEWVVMVELVAQVVKDMFVSIICNSFLANAY